MMGVTQAAGLSLRWLRDLFTEPWTYERMTEEAAQAPPGADVCWRGDRNPSSAHLVRNRGRCTGPRKKVEDDVARL